MDRVGSVESAFSLLPLSRGRQVMQCSLGERLQP